MHRLNDRRTPIGSRSIRSRLALACMLVLSPGVGVAAEVRTARIVLAEGDTPVGGGGLEVDRVNPPFTNGLGEVGFVGELTTDLGGDESFVWIADRIVWRNSDAPFPLDGDSEPTLGFSDNGGFIYSTTFEGMDILISHLGVVAQEGDAAPGFPPEAVSSFYTETTMTPSGRAYWVAGIDLDGDGSTDGQTLYSSPDGGPDSLETILSFGDLVEGFAIADGFGLGLDYQLSDGGEHIHSLQLETGDPDTDEIVYVNGAIAAQEGSPTGEGDSWDRFDLVSINDGGHFVFSGDTDGDTDSDEFVAYDGAIVLREGDTIDGLVLDGSARVRGLSLNELDQVAFVWDYASTETLFFACDAADPRTSAVAIASEGDELDLDGDGVGDVTITDFNASEISGPSLSLSEFPVIHAELDLDDGIDEFEAIVEFPLPSCGGALQLGLTGRCPGRVTLEVDGATPSSGVALIADSSLGNKPLPLGPCAGIEAGLAEPMLVGLFAADPAGSISRSARLSQPRCGLLLQALDLATCELTEVVAISPSP